jgi:hypothetical protein
MYDNNDFHQTYWLDALAADYRAKGFSVSFQPFVYGTDFLPIAIGATVTNPVTIDRDADFIWTGSTFAAFNPADAVTDPGPQMTVRHRLATSQRFLENAPVHLTTVYGTGERQYLWFKPLLLPAKSVVQVTVFNGVGVARNLHLSWIGVKAFISRAA